MKFYNDFNSMFNAQSGLKNDMSVFNYVYEESEEGGSGYFCVHSEIPMDPQDLPTYELLVVYGGNGQEVIVCGDMDYRDLDRDIVLPALQQIRKMIPFPCFPPYIGDDGYELYSNEGVLTREEAKNIAMTLDKLINDNEEKKWSNIEG